MRLMETYVNVKTSWFAFCFVLVNGGRVMNERKGKENGGTV